MNIKLVTSVISAVFIASLVAPLVAMAAPTTEVVLESDVSRQAEGSVPTNDWVIYSRVGTPTTAAAFIDGPGTPPTGEGSLNLVTTTGSEKVFAFNYNHIGKKLSDIDAIKYSTYRSAGNEQQVAALNVVIDFNGPNVEGGFSTLVFEPVYNTQQGAVVGDQWQNWTADASGIWWSTRSINGQCSGATGDCDKTWAEIVANNPDATVLGGVGVNQGSGNPGLATAVDAFTFDDITYDFERVAPKPVKATSKEACKNGGWSNFQTEYKNQGDCVSSVTSSSQNRNEVKQ